MSRNKGVEGKVVLANDVFDIGSIFQPPFYLETAHSSLGKISKSVQQVQVLERKQGLVPDQYLA